MINWKIRFKQKWFWITVIPILFLLFDKVYDLVKLMQQWTIGMPLSESEIEALIIVIIGLIFALLALIGVPVDTTTDGYGDSVLALERDVPGANAAEEAMVEVNIGELNDLVSEEATDPELPSQEPVADLED